jgi:nicotinate-nucleotide adenylyltransferase
MMKILRTGLFFGSFNPIHMGHLIVAQHMQQELDLEKVIFIVSPQNPFKSESELWPENTRLGMVKEAIKDNPYLEVSDVEFQLEKPSYTHATLKVFKETFPQQEFCLIMGSDNLNRLKEWKEIDSILADHRIEVYQRPNSRPYTLFHEHIRVHKTPLIDISASFIRDRLKKGFDVKYLVPERVIGMIPHDF